MILGEGAIYERLHRDPRVCLDPHIQHAGLIYEASGQAALTKLHHQYLDIGRAHDLPMIVFTPTWQASPLRLRAAGFGQQDDVNGDGFRFLSAIRAEYGEYARRVYVGGLTGCQGDAYDPSEALGEDEAAEYHRHQTCALSAAGVDLLLAATLPAASEALGIARAMAECDVPYLLSFVIRPTGTLLDGTPLHEVVSSIDAADHRPPLGYMVNCAHPSVFAEALSREIGLCSSLRHRVIGLQANTSPRSPEELDTSEQLETESPETFADAMADVHRRFGTQILGGCCGTDDRHICCLAERMSADSQPK